MTILITGPESTGKTTLAKSMADHLQMCYLPEEARLYLEENGPTYGQQDILRIAKAHVQNYQQITSFNGMVLDTYLLNIKVWSQDKFDTVHPWIDKQLNKFRPDLTLLCYPDLEWEFDPLRENPDDRARILDLFRTELKTRQWPYHIVRGHGKQRLETALRYVRNYKESTMDRPFK